MNPNRKDEVVNLVSTHARVAVKAKLMLMFERERSEHDINILTEEILQEISRRLLHDYEFENKINEGDIWLKDKINAPSILKAVKDYAASSSNTSHRVQLEFLTQHMRNTFKAVSLLGGQHAQER